MSSAGKINFLFIYVVINKLKKKKIPAEDTLLLSPSMIVIFYYLNKLLKIHVAPSSEFLQSRVGSKDEKK